MKLFVAGINYINGFRGKVYVTATLRYQTFSRHYIGRQPPAPPGRSGRGLSLPTGRRGAPGDLEIPSPVVRSQFSP